MSRDTADRFRIDYNLVAATPQEVITGLCSELEHHIQIARAHLPRAAGIKQRAVITSEIETLERLVETLCRTTVTVTPPAAKSKWGYEQEFESAIELIAATPLARETPGTRDDITDCIITLARVLKAYLSGELKSPEKANAIMKELR